MAPKRIDQFRVDRPAISIVPPLYPKVLESARQLLKLATETIKTTGGDYTTHGPSAAVLAVLGFDLWLFDVAFALTNDPKDMRALLEMNTPKRYRNLFRRGHPAAPAPDLGDLEIAVEVRNEITHHFRRPSSRHLPTWVPTLEDRGLLPASPLPPEVDPAEVYFDLTAKLSAYVLTCWVFQVVEGAVKNMLSDTKRGRLL